MSLLDLQKALQAQADAHQNVVTLSAAVVQGAGLQPRDNFDTLLKSRLLVQSGLAVTVDQAIPAPEGSALAFSGKSSFLGLKEVSVSVTFTDEGGAEASGPVDLRVSTSMGDKWEFSQSFSGVQGYPFNQLTFNGATYAFTTAPTDSYTWESQSIPLVQGLNFVAALVWGGALGVLQDILQDVAKLDQITLAGTVDPSALASKPDALPTLALVASIKTGVNSLPSYFPLSNPRVGLDTSQATDGSNYYRLSFLTTLNIDGTPYGDLKTSLLADSTSFG
ncbi:MAG: hypothetical protein M3328_08635, partial [Chloroflexota bacterium]|nr:hypothetical protein [Chloroflexota bacterium]